MADEGVIPHIVLEKEFDRVLMEETGRDPDHYYPACGIVPRMSDMQSDPQGDPTGGENSKYLYFPVKMMEASLPDLLVCDDHGRKCRVVRQEPAAGRQNRTAL